MIRALRAATIGVLLVSPVALSACSAGQVTQTATQDRDKTGSMAEVGDLTLREISLAYPNGGAYRAGGDAELQMAIANDGEQDDALVSIEGEGFDGVEVTPAESTATTVGTAPGNGIAVPTDSIVFLGAEDGPTVTLTGLAEELTPAESLELTLTFQRAGEVTVLAIVGTPDRSLPRGEPFDFHHEGNEGNEENTEVSGGVTSESGG